MEEKKSRLQFLFELGELSEVKLTFYGTLYIFFFLLTKLCLQSDKCMQIDEKMSRALGRSDEADFVEIRDFHVCKSVDFFFSEAFLCSAFLLFSRIICGQLSSQEAVADRQTDRPSWENMTFYIVYRHPPPLPFSATFIIL